MPKIVQIINSAAVYTSSRALSYVQICVTTALINYKHLST